MWSDKMNRRELLQVGLASLASTMLSPVAFAQRYPDRPIRLVVPFAPGGVTDVIGRLWAEKVKSPLGTVYIENQGGAGGVTGAAEVARAQPDGYTILLGNTSTQVLNPAIMPRVPYDPLKDFAPITMLCITATSIVVNPSVPARNLKELIDHAKANPGKLSYGSPGAGTLTNLAGEMFKQFTGTDIVHVPYRGAGPGIADLVSGHIPVMAANVTSQLLDLHRTEKVRILAVTAASRLKAAPDIPTAVEAGVPNLVLQLFNALFAPAATPRPIIEQIAQATRTAMADKDFLDLMIKSGFEPMPDSGPDKLQQFINEEQNRLMPVIKATGFKM
jgi:tripartite-type tricarboxylate transporter receptor subunit TctC